MDPSLATPVVASEAKGSGSRSPATLRSRLAPAALALCALAALGAALPAPAAAATCDNSWGGGMGNFQEGSKWSEGHVPTIAENACIEGSARVTVLPEDEGVADVKSLHVGSGATVIVHGESADLFASQLSVTEGLTNNGTLEIDCDANPCSGNTEFISTTTLTNNGTIATMGHGSDAYLQGKIVNKGTFEAHDESRFTGGTGSEVINEGTVKIADGAVLSTQKHFTNGAGGSIESTGTGHFLETGHFIQGEGTTSGEPVVLHGGTGAALEFEGGGASSFLMDEGSGFGLSGTMSPSQSLTIHREDGDLNTSVSITGPFTNEGSIVVECGEEAGSCTGGSESLSGGGTEPFTNKGTIVLRGRGTDLYLQGKIVNEGTFEAHDESRFTGGTGSEVINEGTVKIADGAVLSTQKHFTNGAGGSIESTGTGHFLETGHFIQGEGTTSGEPVHFTGGTGAALELTGSGESSFLMEGGSSFGLSGNLAPLQSLAIYRESGDSSATVSTSGAFTNAGTLLIGCGTEAALCTEGTQEYLSVSTAGGAKLTNTGAITLQGRGSAARLLGNVLNEGGTIVAHDYARITGGSFEQTAGTTSAVAGGELEAPSLALAGGTLGGGGTFTGSVVNSGGTVSPGASPGILTIGGDYTQESSGALSAEIEGATVGAQYDRLVVEGAASLDGTLAIFSAPGFVPADGQQFTVLSAGSLSGSFSNVTGTYVPGGPGNYGVAVGSGEVVLAYVAVPRYALTVAMSGTGSGSVTCDGGSCASSYLEGTTVTLGAVPAAGSSFAGWSGAGCSGTGNCVVTLNADTAVTASFSASPPPTGTGPPPTGTGPPPTGTGPPPNNSKQKKKHTYGQCVAAANKAFKKAKRAARHKHGRARAQAIKVARKRRGKRVAKCRKRFGKRRHGKHRKRHRHRKRTSRH